MLNEYIAEQLSQAKPQLLSNSSNKTDNQHISSYMNNKWAYIRVNTQKFTTTNAIKKSMFKISDQ